MLLKDGTNTRQEVQGPGKYCDEMAVILDSLYLNGDDGDSSVAIGEGIGYTRHGRRVLSWSDVGFLISTRFNSAQEAESFMNDQEDEAYGEDNS